MKQENVMTIRTIGLYIVLAGLCVGFFTAALLVAKHRQESQVTRAVDPVPRDDSRYTLAVASQTSAQTESAGTEGLPAEAAPDSVTAAPSPTPRQATSPDSTNVPAPSSVQAAARESAPVFTAQPQAPQQAVEQQTPAVASAPEQPGLLGKLTDGLLGVLALR